MVTGSHLHCGIQRDTSYAHAGACLPVTAVLLLVLMLLLLQVGSRAQLHQAWREARLLEDGERPPDQRNNSTNPPAACVSQTAVHASCKQKLCM